MTASTTATLQPEDIGIIVLAAGYSRRFGSDKRLTAMPDGRSLLASTLSRIPADFSRRLLVLHPGDETLARDFAADWPLCFAADAAAGMGHSLAAAIRQIHRDWPAAMIALGDMPEVKAATYTAIRQALCEHDIVRPVYRQQHGNPCGFRASCFTELATLTGDQGARNLLRREQANVYLLDCADAGVVQDIDAPADLHGQAGRETQT